MPISDKDRKCLWAMSGNICAICRKELVLTNENKSDFNIGEECHIVSSKPFDPRHEDGWMNYDNYKNLILQCRNHHKTIDDNSNLLVFPKEHLIEIKDKHEAWVKKQLSNMSIEDRIEFVKSGANLAAILSGAFGLERTNDCVSSREKAEYIGSIWQTMTDYMYINSDWEPYQQTQTEYNLQELLNEMAQKGYFIYGTRVTRIIKHSHGKSDKWPVALIYIRNENLPSIYKEAPIS